MTETITHKCVSYSIRAARRPAKKANRERILISQKRKCRWCGKFCKRNGRGGDPTQFTIDHVIPLSVGGTNHWMNLVGSCFKCNNKRNKKWEHLRIVRIKNDSTD